MDFSDSNQMDVPSALYTEEVELANGLARVTGQPAHQIYGAILKSESTHEILEAHIRAFSQPKDQQGLYQR
jgi:hypothetical protein